MKKKAKRRADQRSKAKAGELTDTDLEKAVGGVGLTEGAAAGPVVSTGSNVGSGGSSAGQMNEVVASDNTAQLQVQMQMQHENQVFSSVSNVLKTRHDTAKNSIGNIR